MATTVVADVFTSYPSVGQPPEGECPETGGRAGRHLSGREEVESAAAGAWIAGSAELLNCLGVKDKRPLPDGKLVQ